MMVNNPSPADRDDLEKQDSRPAFKYLAPQDFAFDEDVWNFSFRSRVARRSSGKVSFVAFPDPIKHAVKEFIIHGTLVVGLSNTWMGQALAALKKALLPLWEQHGPQFSFLSLTQQDAMIVEDTISQSGVTNARGQIAIVARFAEFLRERYDGQPSSFRPRLQAAARHHYMKRSYSEGLEQVIPDEVSDALMEAMGRYQIFLDELVKRSKAKRPPTAHLYLAALTLLIFSGRRISEILFLKSDCLREPTAYEMEKTGQSVWLEYHNTKVGLGLREIFVPDPAAGLVRQAVKRAQTLTEPLMKSSGLDLLFLSPTVRGEPRVLDSGHFTRWLSGRTSEDGHILQTGFIHRYNVRYQGQYYYINLHQTRHTLAYKAYLGGASYVDVGDHLHHKRSRTGLSPMTGVYLHGQEKDVQLIREMHSRRVVAGKAAPLIDNRFVILNNLASSDISIWKEQGMVLHPTLYGHCILPDINGPCVCGDPCWIGPQGNGCDYALYTPESKYALLSDKELLVSQLEALEQKHPQHPRLGQWNARLDRLDQVLNEISVAESQVMAGECSERPRAQIIPQEPLLKPLLAHIPAQRAIRKRRRESAKKFTSFARKNNSEPLQELQELDEQTLMRATRILDEFTSIKATLTPQEFSRRLKIPIHALYQNTYICDLLSQHNKQCCASIEETMRVRLEELRERGEPISQKEFLALCGISRNVFSESFPEWINKLHQHNENTLTSQRRIRAEQRMQEILAEGRGCTTRDFARDIGMALPTIMKESPEIVQALMQYNKDLHLNHAWRENVKHEKIALIYECWNKIHQEEKLINISQFSRLCQLSPTVIRRHCPELIAQFHQLHHNLQHDIQDENEIILAGIFTETEQTNAELSLKQFAIAAGITVGILGRKYSHWKVRLEEHNKKITHHRLQATWERMESNGAIWSPIRFAREANIYIETLQNGYADWFERVNSNYTKSQNYQHAHLIRQKIYTAIEESKRTQVLRTPNEIAKQVGIVGSTLSKHHSDLYQSLVEHNKTAFKPIVEATWKDVLELGSSPTLSEFAKLCGFRHFSVLLAYFPDIAEQVRSQASTWGK